MSASQLEGWVFDRALSDSAYRSLGKSVHPSEHTIFPVDVTVQRWIQIAAQTDWSRYRHYPGWYVTYRWHNSAPATFWSTSLRNNYHLNLNYNIYLKDVLLVKRNLPVQYMWLTTNKNLQGTKSKNQGSNAILNINFQKFSGLFQDLIFPYDLVTSNTGTVIFNTM